MYDLAIIGGGPAGVSAGIYSARKKLKTIIMSDFFQGQSAVSPEIQNWIGVRSISGEDLAKQLTDHLRSYESDILTIKEGDLAVAITKIADGFEIKTNQNNLYTTKTILIATGGRRRKLTIAGAKEFDQKGVTYCASCDGPLFSDQDVVVIGGGNAGFNTASQLLAYCRSVTLLESGPTFRAEQITIDSLLKNPKFKALSDVEIIAIKGEQFVNQITYKKSQTGETIEQPVTGVFVEIGFEPNTDLVKGLVNMTPTGAIMVDHQHQTTSTVGIWSAGDSADGLYHQNNIATGDAIKAVEDIYSFLQKNN